MKTTIITLMLTFVWSLLIGCTNGSTSLAVGNEQKITPYVQDLVGARGRDGEGRLKERGFRWVKTQKIDESSYTFWQHNISGQCLSVRTLNGRYDALVKTPVFDCEVR